MHRIIKKLNKRKITDVAIMSMGVLLPLQLYFNLFGSVDITVCMVLLLLLCILIPSELFNRFTTRIKTVSPFKYFIGLCLVFTVHVFFTSDVKNAVKLNAFIWMGPIFYLILADIPKKRLIKLMKLVVIFSVPIVILALLQSVSQDLKMKILEAGFMKLFINPGTLKGIVDKTAGNNILQNGRGGGFFVNVNIAAIYFNLIICFLLGNIFQKRKISYKDIIFIGIFIAGVAATASSAGIGIMGLLLFIGVVMALINKNIRFNKSGLTMLIILGIGFIVFLTLHGGGTALGRLERKLNSNITGGRGDIWKNSVETIKEKWVFGYGLAESNWREAYERISGDSNVQPAHNLFLETWRYTGIGGVFFLLLFFFSSFKRYIINEKPVVKFLGLLVISTLFLHGMTENLYFMNIRVHLTMWLTFAVVEAYAS
ncbi:MAG: O-antigen ligase family protein [Elusimicrobiota bacterium]